MDTLASVVIVLVSGILVYWIDKVTKWFRKMEWERKHDAALTDLRLGLLSQTTETEYTVYVPYWIYRLCLSLGWTVGSSHTMIPLDRKQEFEDEGSEP